VEALAAGRVAGRVHQRDRDVAHLHHVATLVLHQLVDREPAGTSDPGGLVALHVHGALAALEQRCDALHVVPTQ